MSLFPINSWNQENTSPSIYEFSQSKLLVAVNLNTGTYNLEEQQYKQELQN
jgi:hypothetical protein